MTLYFDTRDELIAHFIKPGMVVCEIGTFEGEFAKKMSNLNPSVVVCIDGFHDKMVSGDQDGNNMKEVYMPDIYNKLCSEADKYRLTINRGWSFDILPKYPNETFDFIYVDGDHSYEGCKRDLILCSQKIKRGGFIAGHDYFVNIAKMKGTFQCGVGKAVNEFCEEYGWKVIALGMDGCVSYVLEKEPETNLCSLAEKYGSDKCPKILHSYTPAYNEVLTPVRNSTSVVIEIGIGNPQCMSPIVGTFYKPGASLRMWEEYFPNATIFGCDIRRDVLFNEGRIQCLYLDQSSTESLESLYTTIYSTKGQADLILDDGSHIKEHQMISFQNLWKLVKTGGFYIIEDIEGDSTSMEFLSLPTKFGFLNYEVVFCIRSIHTKHGNWYSICFKKTF